MAKENKEVQKEVLKYEVDLNSINDINEVIASIGNKFNREAVFTIIKNSLKPIFKGDE